MTDLIRAEVLKVRTTRMRLGMFALAIGYTLFQLGILIATAVAPMGGQRLDLNDPAAVRLLYGSAAAGILFSLVLGLIGMTGEYRHQTITHTFLLTPRRGRVVAAKLIAYAVIGAAFGVVADALTVAVALPALALRHGTTTLTGLDIPMILGGTVLAYALYALLGLGLGALVRNQVAAIAIAVGWVQLVDGLLGVLVPDVGRWLPGGAVRALTRSTGFGEVRLDTLPAWAGAVTLLAYGVVFAAIAAATTLRRDIT